MAPSSKEEDPDARGHRWRSWNSVVAGIVPALPQGVTRINRMDRKWEVIHQTQELDRTGKIVVGHRVGHSEVEGRFSSLWVDVLNSYYHQSAQQRNKLHI